MLTMLKRQGMHKKDINKIKSKSKYFVDYFQVQENLLCGYTGHHNLQPFQHRSHKPGNLQTSLLIILITRLQIVVALQANVDWCNVLLDYFTDSKFVISYKVLTSKEFIIIMLCRYTKTSELGGCFIINFTSLSPALAWPTLAYKMCTKEA